MSDNTQLTPEELGTNATIQREVEGMMRAIATHESDFRALVKGKRIRILVDWRDQPYGRSKPNLKGKEFTVTSGSIEGTCAYIQCDGLWCLLDTDFVEFV